MSPEATALLVTCLTCGAARDQPCRRFLPRRPLEQPHPSRVALGLRHGRR